MYISTKYLHVFLDIGDALLSSGAEIFRVEDTLNRMGYACGATQMNVFVITSSIVITMEFPEENVRTQTRRIRKTGGNDFTKLERLNDLSRRFCQHPISPEELREEFDQIDKVVPTQIGKLAGSILAAFSFALFYGGSLWDALAAGIAAVLIWGAQRYLREYCMNEVTFQFVVSFLTGCMICVAARVFPALHVDKIMIGDIMLLIPGLMATNAIRDVLIGDTISGAMRFIEAMLLAAVLAFGFIGAIYLLGRL
nr:threonine/serine exporter family protein [uncultured Mediterraneibacter sp.]